MFTLYGKLKLLKANLKNLNKAKLSNLSARVQNAKNKLLQLQNLVLNENADPTIIDNEKEAATSYYHWMALEESLLKQKYRNRWLKLGDHNAVYFFNSMKKRQNRYHIGSLKLDSGIITQEMEVI